MALSLLKLVGILLEQLIHLDLEQKLFLGFEFR